MSAVAHKATRSAVQFDALLEDVPPNSFSPRKKRKSRASDQTEPSVGPCSSDCILKYLESERSGS